MPLKADHIFALFLNLMLTSITGESNYTTIRILQNQTNQNLSVIPSNLGYGIKGIMWLAITLVVYDTISLAAIPSPCNFGSTSVVPSSTKSPANVAKVHAKYDIQVKFYEEFIVADQLFYQTPCCCY